MGLLEDIRREPIASLTLRPAVVITPEMSVRKAVSLMRINNLSALIAVDPSGIPIGLFTEKLLIRLLAQQPQAMDGPVSAHLSRRIVCMKQSDTIAKLIAVMQENDLRWVCVVDKDGKPVALSGLRGVMSFVADCLPRISKVQSLEPKLSMQNREGA